MKLPNCPSQKQDGAPHFDCADFTDPFIVGDHRSGRAIRYVRSPNASLNTVVFEHVSVYAPVSTYFTYPDVDTNAHAVDLPFAGNRATVVPVIRPSGKRMMAIWVNYRPPDAEKFQTIQLDDLPYGRLVLWRDECRLFAVGEPGRVNPWRMTLYRVQDVKRYDNSRPSFEALGKLEAVQKPDGTCIVTGADAMAKSGLPASDFDNEMCQWLDNASTGILHHIPDCKDPGQ